MNASVFQRLSMQKAAVLETTDRLTNAVLGLTGEAGECADVVKKWRYQGHALDTAKLKEELGDVLFYVALACDSLDLDLGDVMAGNIEKLRRRYPDGFSTAASLNRSEA